MIAFVPCKVNIGLRIIDKRADGYHNLDSYLYPVPFHDILEVNESNQNHFEQTGIISTERAEDNLVVKAWHLMREQYTIPPLSVHLHKQIPTQAGLGGGSSDAVSMLRLLQKKYAPNMPHNTMQKLALALGSDCPFFLQDAPAHITGRGEYVEPIQLSLAGKYLALVKAPIAISTATAFAQVRNSKVEPLPAIQNLPLAEWQTALPNEFENYMGKHTDSILTIKQQLINKGAFYAALSGSGSTVFGLFHHHTPLSFPTSYFYQLIRL